MSGIAHIGARLGRIHAAGRGPVSEGAMG